MSWNARTGKKQIQDANEIQKKVEDDLKKDKPQDASPKIDDVIDFAAERYRFCAESGLATDQKCTEWKRMQHWTYGDYTFIGDSIGDQLFEVLNDGSRFIQAQGVVGGNTLVRYGRCERR